MDAVFVSPRRTSRQVVAVVEEVLPTLGLAYMLDDAHCRWAVTRSTPGSGLHSLDEGHKVALTISQLDDFEMASAYAPLD